MKIKQQSEDFQVEELTDLVPAPGPFAFYRLEKRGWTTLDAIGIIRRRWKLDRRRISHGGLKDRHALTVQYITIYRGPERNLTHQRLTLTYLGHLPEAYASGSFRGNRFQITLRAMRPEQITAAQSALDEVRTQGFPNYFDDQRFGSVATAGEFMARALLAGNLEEALRRALTNPYEFDRRQRKKEKERLLSHWGDWARCKKLLPPSLADYLVHHPTDFRGAIERMPPELRGLYLSAYQSYLWNRMLARWLRSHLDPAQLLAVRLRLDQAPIHRHLNDSEFSALARLWLPLPSSRMELDDSDPRRLLVREILQEEGVTLEQFKLRGIRTMFFSRGNRAALCTPAELSHAVAADELNAGRQKLVFRCDLPRGSYATLMVKRISLPALNGNVRATSLQKK